MTIIQFPTTVLSAREIADHSNWQALSGQLLIEHYDSDPTSWDNAVRHEWEYQVSTAQFHHADMKVSYTDVINGMTAWAEKLLGIKKKKE